MRFELSKEKNNLLIYDNERDDDYYFFSDIMDFKGLHSLLNQLNDEKEDYKNKYIECKRLYDKLRLKVYWE